MRQDFKGHTVRTRVFWLALIVAILSYSVSAEDTAPAAQADSTIEASPTPVTAAPESSAQIAPTAASEPAKPEPTQEVKTEPATPAVAEKSSPSGASEEPKAQSTTESKTEEVVKTTAAEPTPAENKEARRDPASGDSEKKAVTTTEKPVASSDPLDDSPSPTHPGHVQSVLKAKFKTKKGKQVRIFLLPPVQVDDEQAAEVVNVGIEKAFARLDNLTVSRASHKIGGLSLEQFQRAVAKTGADILLVPSIKSTKWDLMLYDRRTPYQIFLQSEILPESFRKKPTEVAKTSITRNLVSQLWYQYATNENFDLPREKSEPLLQTEIPRWMASTDLMRSINSEMRSRYYVSASIGGMVTRGYEDRDSSSSMLALQFGYRPFRSLFSNLVVEVGGQLFNYNALLGGLKYFFQSKTTTARFYVGLAYSYVTSRKTLATDNSGGGAGGLGRTSNYLVPSLALVVPVGDVLIKAEAQYFTSIDERTNHLYSFMPGIFIPF